MFLLLICFPLPRCLVINVEKVLQKERMLRDSRLFASGFVTLLLLLACSQLAECSGPPFIFGMLNVKPSTGDGTTDLSRSAGAMLPMADGLLASLHAANDSGGINGRAIQVVSCDVSTTEPNKSATDCLTNFSRYYPTMLALTGTLLIDELAPVVAPLIVKRNSFYFPASFNTEAYRGNHFSKNWIFSNAEPNARFLKTVANVVQKFHLRRVGFLTSSFSVTVEGKSIESSIAFDYAAASRMLKTLQVECTGMFVADAKKTNFSWRDDTFLGWLSNMPQAIFVFSGTPTTVIYEVFLDAMMRIGDVNDATVVRELVVVTTEQVLPAAEEAAAELARKGGAVAKHFFSDNRIYVTTSSPSLSDGSDFAAMKRASKDLENLRGNYKNLPSALSSRSSTETASYLVTAARGWIAAEVVLAALRKMAVTNHTTITTSMLREYIFDSSVFAVDDMLFGIFSNPCVGIRAATNLFCECNEGYRMSDVYAFVYNSSKTAVVPLPASGSFRSSYPLQDCHSSVSTVPPHLVYLAATQTDPVSSAASALMLQGLRGHDEMIIGAAQSEASTPPARSEFEYVNSSTVPNLTRAMEVACATKYISAVFGYVASSEPTPADGTASAGLIVYPQVDPLYFPAKLPSAYQSNVLLISATLEQEIFSIAKTILSDQAPSSGSPQNVGRTIHALVRGNEALLVVEVVKKSVISFGGMLETLAVISGNETPIPWQGFTGKSGYLFVIGLSHPSHVSALFQMLDLSPLLTACVSFVEFSVLYDDFVGLCNTSQHTSGCARIIFATSMRHWNAPQLANESDLMAGYFSRFDELPSSSTSARRRHPLTLRGFIAAAALRRVLSEISDAYVPTSILQKWYRTSVIELGAQDSAGPYSNTPCTSSSSSLCEVNAGARTVRVMRAYDAIIAGPNAVNSSESLLLGTVEFSSAVIPYRIPSVNGSWSLSTQTLIYICAVACIFLGCGALFNAARRTGHFTRLMTSGMLFTLLRLVLHILHLSIVILSVADISQQEQQEPQQSGWPTLVTAYIVIAALAVLSCLVEMSFLVMYMYAELTAGADGLEDEMTTEWQILLVEVSLVTLVASDMPLGVITFTALLLVTGDISVFLLVAFAMACLFCGSKQRMVKEVFKGLIKHLAALFSSSRVATDASGSGKFADLKSVSRLVLLTRRLSQNHASSSAAANRNEDGGIVEQTEGEVDVLDTVSYSSPRAEIDEYLNRLQKEQPIRYRNVRYRAKRIVLQLDEHDVSSNEYFAVIRPLLLREFGARDMLGVERGVGECDGRADETNPLDGGVMMKAMAASARSSQPARSPMADCIFMASVLHDDPVLFMSSIVDKPSGVVDLE